MKQELWKVCNVLLLYTYFVICKNTNHTENITSAFVNLNCCSSKLVDYPIHDSNSFYSQSNNFIKFLRNGLWQRFLITIHLLWKNPFWQKHNYIYLCTPELFLEMVQEKHYKIHITKSKMFNYLESLLLSHGIIRTW